jgi:hypothetical protein
LAKTAKKGPKVSQNAAKAGSKNPVSAREIRKTAKILGLLKRPGGAASSQRLPISSIGSPFLSPFFPHQLYPTVTLPASYRFGQGEPITSLPASH